MGKRIRIIIYDGKHGQEYWIAETREQVRAALRELFTMLDGMGCYTDWSNNDIQDLLPEARGGSHRAIYEILRARQSYEYEGWRTEYATDATQEADDKPPEKLNA